MSGETMITVVGNLVDEVELRFVPNGSAVAKFRVASTPRTYNKQTQAWEDGESLFLPCSVWRQQAENVAESLTKGMRVVVQGRLKQRSYELDVEEVAASLKSATAKVTKTSGGSSGGGRQQARQAAGSGEPWTSASQQAGQGGGGAWGSGEGDEPPF